MKKVFSFSIALFIILFFIGCNLEANSADSNPSKEETSFEIDIPGTGASGSKSINDDASVSAAYLKVFDKDRNLLTISGNDYLAMTEVEGSGWKSGSFTVDTTNAPITFLVYGVNVSDQHLYSGELDWNTGSSTSFTITTWDGYTYGQVGPGGGYIYYDKGSYSDSWRYLEAAPVDLTLDWTADLYVDTTTHVVTNGEVYLIGSPDTAVLTKYDFYWGPAGSTSTDPDYTFLTTAPAGDGQVNTFTRLDAASSATPKLKKANGRKAVPVDSSTNTRRDTPDTLKTWTKNGFVDWFVPSKDEINAMYTRIGSSGGFASAYYWSSTEDLTEPYYTDEDPSDGVLAIPNAYAKNFGSGTGVDMQRDTPSRVRPSRRF